MNSPGHLGEICLNFNEILMQSQWNVNEIRVNLNDLSVKFECTHRQATMCYLFLHRELQRGAAVVVGLLKTRTHTHTKTKNR